MPAPDYQHEAVALASGATRVAGVDEAGRGPLAGPVIAAAVVLDLGRLPAGLNDSKQLTAALREVLLADLQICALIGIGQASVEEIDSLNILRASHLAMLRAVASLPLPPDHLLIDGNLLPRGLPCPATALVKGDARCLSIAAASIAAKVTRDRIMVDLAQQFPGYGWDRNAGYPTPGHYAALRQLGVTPAHRRSFRPIHNILYQDISLTP